MQFSETLPQMKSERRVGLYLTARVSPSVLEVLGSVVML